MLWISFFEVEEVALELVLEGKRLERAGGGGGGRGCRRPPVGAGRGGRCAGGARGAGRGAPRLRAGGGGRAAAAAGGGGRRRQRRLARSRSSFSSTERKSTFGLRRGVVQLHQQRGDVLVRRHGLAEPAEARVQARELDLRLRELDLLLLGLVERLLRRGDVLVELRELLALRRQARNQKAPSTPTRATTAIRM